MVTSVSWVILSSERQQSTALVSACFLGEEKVFSTSEFTVKKRN